MKNSPSTDIVIVLPAYHAEKTLEATIASIPSSLNAKILVVDDASKDRTVEIARRMGIETIVHEKNIGYGGNQKTCYRWALEQKAGIIIMLHPDYQYDARMLPALILPIQLGICDIMLGNRVRSRKEALGGGMPFYKYLANRGLTVMENLLLGQNLGEFHSGMRAYRSSVLKQVPWENNSDDFVFDQQFLIQSVFFNCKMGDVPVPTRYFAEASSINFTRSMKYGLQALLCLVRYFMARLGVYRSQEFIAPKNKS